MIEVSRDALDRPHVGVDARDVSVQSREAAVLDEARHEERHQRQEQGRDQRPRGEHLLTSESSGLDRRRDEIERGDVAVRGCGHRQIQGAARLGHLGQVALGARRPRRIRDRYAEVEKGRGGGAVARHPDRVAGAPPRAGEAAPRLREQGRVIGGGEAPAEHDHRVVQQEQLGRVADTVEPHHALTAIHIDQREQIVRGHRDRHRPQLRFVGQTQRGINQPAVGGGDQHAPALDWHGVGFGIRWQGNEIERGVVGRNRQMALELELHHVLRRAGHRRELDRLHGDGRAGETDRDRSRGERPRVELGAQRRGRIFGFDRERLDTIALDRGDAEPVAEHDDREADGRELRDVKFHQVRVTPLTDRRERVNGAPTTPERPPTADRRRCASGRSPSAGRSRDRPRCPPPRRETSWSRRRDSCRRISRARSDRAR